MPSTLPSGLGRGASDRLGGYPSLPPKVQFFSFQRICPNFFWAKNAQNVVQPSITQHLTPGKKTVTWTMHCSGGGVTPPCSWTGGVWFPPPALRDLNGLKSSPETWFQPRRLFGFQPPPPEHMILPAGQNFGGRAKYLLGGGWFSCR